MSALFDIYLAFDQWRAGKAGIMARRDVVYSVNPNKPAFSMLDDDDIASGKRICLCSWTMGSGKKSRVSYCRILRFSR